MDNFDNSLVSNRDWDPCYLNEIFSQDFYDYTHHWQSNIGDMELVKEVEKVEKYCPVVEDISLHDEALCSAVEKIEQELHEPETVQYFQFDMEGNMYVFAPGAGCSGNAKLVRPGDELIFSSQYYEGKSEWPPLPQIDNVDEPIAYTCPIAASDCNESGRRFKDPLSMIALEELTHKNFSDETMKKVRWVVKMYCKWHNYRHSLGLEYISCDLDNKSTITEESLKFGMCRFITEIKKVNGSDFPGKTLYDIVVCVQFHLETMGFAWKLINDEGFKDLKFMLDNVMKLRTSQGVGNSVRKADVLTATGLSNSLFSLFSLCRGNPVFVSFLR